MFPKEDAQREAFVYRRIPKNKIEIRNARRTPSITAFRLGESEDGLSVFSASIASPRETLQAYIDVNLDQMKRIEDEQVSKKAAERHRKTPDVKTMFERGWRVAKIPMKLILGYRLTISEPEENGHCEIIGDKGLLAGFPMAVEEWLEDSSVILLDDPVDYDLTET